MQTLEEGSESVVRHFKYATRYYLEETGEGCLEAGEQFYLEEGVRLIMFQSGGCSIFYEQGGRNYEWWTGIYRPEWSHQNPCNRRMKECYLYPDGIEEALKGTSYESLTRAFQAMAAGRIKGKYNEAMAVGLHRRNLGNVLELLYKRGFRTLLKETMNNCDVWQGHYYGTLEIDRETERAVFGLDDKQKINRIRQNDGGESYLKWMREAEFRELKLSDKFMTWATRNNVSPDMFEEFPNSVMDSMSYEKIMNYIERQKPNMPPHYRGQVYSTIETWLDYLDMCIISGIKIKDSLFYAPKDLKSAHDAVVVEKEKLEILKRTKGNKEYKESRAQEAREKFPEAQKNLSAIAAKYEYTGEEYTMIIPKDLYEIVEEGQALHHCGGSSDRYFNRIENKETYIGFLRRVGEETIPYYTIEFEPNGTIRQSRSLYDEEPNIEQIRPFLKEWQQVIKKRLTEEDRMDQRRSAELRQKNIEELREKKNTFVLSKLEEDFMEAV